MGDPQIDALVPEMMARYEARQSARVIAKRLGVSHDTVYRRLRLAGVTVRPVGFTSTPPETRALAVRMYADNTPSTKVASALGVARTSVIKWARAAGVEVRERVERAPATPPDVIADAVRRYAADESSVQVAQSLGVSRHTVLAWVRRAGGTVRPRSYQVVRRAPKVPVTPGCNA